MSGLSRITIRTIASVVKKYQRSIAIAATVLAVYALVGFVLAPWLVKKQAIEVVADTFGSELTVEKVAINPFVLSLRVDGIALKDPSGAPFLRVQQVFVNFQSSSLFRWAWTFEEVRIDSPEAFLARGDDASLNAAFLLPKRLEPVPTAEPEVAAAAPLRLLIFDFALNDSVINWSDAVPVDPVVTRFGPINIAVAELNTLPDRSGQQDVVITTETNGTLAWSGSLNLNPLMSAGHASVKGSHFPLASAYIKHAAGFDIVDGTVDLELDYEISLRDDGALDASIANLNFASHDVQISTFNQAFEISEPDREVLRLPLLRLTGGSFDLLGRSVLVQALSIDDAVVSLYRDDAGRLNIVPPMAGARAADDSGESPRTESASTTEGNWLFSLSEFDINRMAIGLEDDSVDPSASIGNRSLDLSIRDISNEPAALFPTSVRLLAGGAGSISLDGDIRVLPARDIRLDLRVENLALSDVHPYLQPLADVNLDSGALNFAGKLASSRTDSFSLEGDLQIVDFLITETDQGSRLGSWTALNASNVTLSAANRRLEISEIQLDEPYADILIAEDGSVNLGRVRKGGQPVADDDTPDGTVAPPAAATADGGEIPLEVTVGRVRVANAAADFVDLSLPLPFAAKIAELSGELSTISTASSEPSTVSLEGKVDEFGFVRVAGYATPVDPSENTDIKVTFENIEVPKFSAYTIPFAGREIAKGRLDLALGYKVNEGELAGENKLVLRDFELGDKIEHPGAMSLPLGLAVALLKDADGRIDIDMPVRGDVDDPEFRYGRVVLKAFGNLITGIAASPFKLLANLVGAESSELEYLRFAYGRSDLTPPELEKTLKIAEALAMRPELMLQFGGVVDREADGAALRTVAFDAAVERRIVSLTAEESGDGTYAERRLDAIEQLYGESGLTTDARAGLAQLRAAHTTSAAENTSAAEGEFDALAYVENLRRLLVDRQPLTEQALSALAAERANNAVAAIVGTNAALETQIEIVESSGGSRSDDEDVRMQMSLTTKGGGNQQ
jgi:hypothetical protein